MPGGQLPPPVQHRGRAELASGGGTQGVVPAERSESRKPNQAELARRPSVTIVAQEPRLATAESRLQAGTLPDTRVVWSQVHRGASLRIYDIPLPRKEIAWTCREEELVAIRQKLQSVPLDRRRRSRNRDSAGRSSRGMNDAHILAVPSLLKCCESPLVGRPCV